MPQINRKTIVPDRYEIKKTGTGKGGPWTLYVVTDQDGIQYKSWGKKYKWEDLLGQEVAIEFEEKVQGQFRDNIIIEDSFRSRNRITLDEVVGKIEALETLVRQVLRETLRPTTASPNQFYGPSPVPEYNPDPRGFGQIDNGRRDVDFGATDDDRSYPVSGTPVQAPQQQNVRQPSQPQQPSMGAWGNNPVAGPASTGEVSAAPRRTTARRPRVLAEDEAVPVIEQDVDF